MLVNGKWTEDWQPVQAKDEKGRFVRQTSSFRHWITKDGSAGPSGDSGFKAEAGRYHLYVAYICPWASRALMVRALKGLEDIISVSVVNPVLGNKGWTFGGAKAATEDHLHGSTHLHQLYTLADDDFTGRATVPVLWDKKLDTMVNNESADIIRMFNDAFNDITGNTLNLYPSALQTEIDSWAEKIYHNLNNGVYKAGFATTQFAYEEAYNGVFNTLDELEVMLSDGRQYLLGDQITELDIRTFVTLVRFDAAYVGVFKCNRNTIEQMPYLHRYLTAMYKHEDIAKTVNIEHIKQGYYSIKTLNPNGIVPAGPDLAFMK